MSASGGLTIRPLPDSIYGLPESDEELLKRLRANTSNQSPPTGKSNNKLIISTTATYDSSSSYSNSAGVSVPSTSTPLPPSPDLPPNFIKRGNNKSRSLSLEEIEATKAAEENVKAFIAKQKSIPPVTPTATTSPSSSSKDPSIFNPLVTNINPQLRVNAIANSQTNTNNPDYNLIDKLLAKSGILPKSTAAHVPPPPPASPQKSSNAATSSPVNTVKSPATAAVSSMSSSPIQQKTVASTTVPPGVPPVPPSIANKKLYVKDTSDKQSNNVPAVPAVPKAPVIKLPTVDEAVLGDSLQWLIKHRYRKLVQYSALYAYYVSLIIYINCICANIISRRHPYDYYI